MGICENLIWFLDGLQKLFTPFFRKSYLFFVFLFVPPFFVSYPTLDHVTSLIMIVIMNDKIFAIFVL